ncbi:MAG: hypothetical protein EBS38_07735 [Actinobacteria bacterium]|jgi:hypothetical protein|nr:hypothetical protein [Actinomycetota bacterium]
MNLQEIYRIALLEGLTAKQAGARFGVPHSSIAKCKHRYGLPSLKNEWDYAVEQQFEKLSDTQLLSYARTLQQTSNNPKWNQSEREVRILNLILEKRKLCLK